MKRDTIGRTRHGGSRRTTRCLAAAALLGALLPSPGAFAGRMSLSSCGAVPAGMTAVLAADVACGFHCSSDETRPCDVAEPELSCARAQDYCVPDTIRLGSASRLYLDGHTIDPAYQGDAVVCGEIGQRGTCFVYGPGRIAGEKGIGVWGRSMNVVVRGLVIDGSDAAVITDGKLVASDLVLGEDRENGLTSGGTMFLRGVVLGGDSGASSAGNVIVRDVTVRGGIVAGGLVRGARVHLVRNGIRARDVDLQDVDGTNVPGQDGPGSVVAERRLRLIRSVVTGNEDYDGNPDVVSGERPRLVHTVCGVSARYADRTATWGVCRDD